MKNGFNSLVAVLLIGFAPALMAQPAIWETDFGTALGLSDDSTADVPLGDFSFPFQGTTYTGTDFVNVSSNGFLSINGDNGDDCCSGDIATLLNDSFGRIAVFWADLNPGDLGDAFVNTFDDNSDTITDRLVITWDTEFFDNSEPITVQAQLFEDGVIVLGYNEYVLAGFDDDTLVGVSPAGGASDPGSSDFTTDIPFDTASEPTAYEFWTGDPPPVDIDQTNIVFTPNGQGGWEVSNSIAGTPPPTGPVNVPALGQVGLLILMLLMLGLGTVMVRNRG